MEVVASFVEKAVCADLWSDLFSMFPPLLLVLLFSYPPYSKILASMIKMVASIFLVFRLLLPQFSLRIQLYDSLDHIVLEQVPLILLMVLHVLFVT